MQMKAEREIKVRTMKMTTTATTKTTTKTKTIKTKVVALMRTRLVRPPSNVLRALNKEQNLDYSDGALTTEEKAKALKQYAFLYVPVMY